MRLRSPLRYYGGKYHMIKHLLPLIPPHRTYVEVFGGGAQLLFAKAPSPVEVYNDIDGRLVNFFRVLQDPEKAMKMLYILANTPYGRSVYKKARETVDEGDEVERAAKFFIAIRQSFGGIINTGAWGYAVTESGNKIARTVTSYLSAIDLLPLLHYRFRRVQIENDDFRKIIPRYDTAETFFYLDPPYVKSTLRRMPPFASMSDQDHEELVELLLNIKGKALLSGYPNQIYKKLERAGWKYKNVERQLAATNPRKNYGGKRIFQKERLWWNYRIRG